MAFITTIAASEAPVAAPKRSEATNEIITALGALAPDEVLRITPDAGKTVRGLKTAIGRVAGANGFAIEQWDVDGVVYVQVNESPEA